MRVQDAKVRWRKRESTIVKMRGYDGENAKLRWWKRESTIMKTWEYDNARVRWWKREAILTFHHRSFVLSRFHYRTFAFSPHHRTLALSPSYFHVFDFLSSYFRNRVVSTYGIIKKAPTIFRSPLCPWVTCTYIYNITFFKRVITNI